MVWGGAGLAVLAGAMTAGNLYADKQLRAYYQQNLNPAPNISVKYSEYEMGWLKGTAQWEMTIIPDPCNGKEKLVFTGQDQIQRSWKGYNIHSQVSLVQGQGQYAGFFTQPLKVNTEVNWLGIATTRLQTPALEKKQAQRYAKVAPMQIEFQSRPSQGQYKILNISLDIPQLTFRDQLGQVQVKGLHFKTNQALNSSALEPGYVEFNIAEMQRQTREASGSGHMQNLNWRIDTELDQHTVDVNSRFNIAKFSLSNVPAMQDIQLNWDIKDLQRDKMQAFFDILQKQNNSCVEAENLEQESIQALLGIINQGFQFESKQNQLSLGTGSIQGSMVGKVMPGHQTTLEGLAKMFPSLLEMQTEVSFNKQVVKTIMNHYLKTSQKTMSDQELEQLLSNMQSKQQIQRDGDELKLSMHYQYGEKTFQAAK